MKTQRKLSKYELLRLRHTDSSIAKATGLRRSTVSRLFSGEREPLISTAYLVSSHLGLSLDEFYEMWQTNCRRG